MEDLPTVGQETLLDIFGECTSGVTINGNI